MKKILASLFLTSFIGTAFAKTETIKIHTQRDPQTKVMSWVADATSVKAGQKYIFDFKNDADKDPPFHGISIPQLKIAKQIDYGQDIKIPVKIPAGLKGQDLDIGCQFHVKHQHVKLKVE